MTVKKIEINEDNTSRRIDNFLISLFPNIPKSKIYNIIRKGEVRVNSSRIRPSYKLNLNDVIRIPPNLQNKANKIKKIRDEDILQHTKDILFENENYIISNKQNDISVHAGSKNYIGLIDIFRKKFGENIDLCHRLDKFTSGCIVFAKNKKAVKHFNKCLITKEIQKKYCAILKGSFNGHKIIDEPIYKNDKFKYKNSLSKFCFKQKLNKTTLVDIEIYTGRSHQIRIHALKLSHPIIFDKKYGDSNFDKYLNIGNHSIALHSETIKFPDIDNNIIEVKAELSHSFKHLIECLK